MLLRCPQFTCRYIKKALIFWAKSQLGKATGTINYTSANCLKLSSSLWFDTLPSGPFLALKLIRNFFYFFFKFPSICSFFCSTSSIQLCCPGTTIVTTIKTHSNNSVFNFRLRCGHFPAEHGREAWTRTLGSISLLLRIQYPVLSSYILDLPLFCQKSFILQERNEKK